MGVLGLVNLRRVRHHADMPPIAVTVDDLPREFDALRAFALEQNRHVCALWEQLQILQHQIAQLNRARFGASSERLAAQAELFDAPVDVPVPPQAEGIPVKEHVRKGRPALLKDIPRTRVEYDLSNEQKAQFDALERIGEERCETLHCEPSKLTVIEHVRFKYAARRDGESTMVTASAQPSPLPKSNASAGLLANILLSTYVDHLPLNRQESIYRRHGVQLSRSTLCDWKLAAAELLEVLLAPLRRHQLKVPRMHVDDTTLPLIEKGRTTTRTARLWGYLGGGQRQENGLWVDHPPAVVFEFGDSRAGSHPLTYLRDFTGFCKLTRTAVTARCTAADASSKLDAGRIAEDASSKSQRHRRHRGSLRRLCSGSRSSMRSSLASRPRRRIASTRCGKPRPCPCLRCFANGLMPTRSACYPKHRWRKRSATPCGTGRRSCAIPNTASCCRTTSVIAWPSCSAMRESPAAAVLFAFIRHPWRFAVKSALPKGHAAQQYPPRLFGSSRRSRAVNCRSACAGRWARSAGPGDSDCRP